MTIHIQRLAPDQLRSTFFYHRNPWYSACSRSADGFDIRYVPTLQLKMVHRNVQKHIQVRLSVPSNWSTHPLRKMRLRLPPSGMLGRSCRVAKHAVRLSSHVGHRLSLSSRAAAHSFCQDACLLGVTSSSLFSAIYVLLYPRISGRRGPCEGVRIRFPGFVCQITLDRAELGR